MLENIALYILSIFCVYGFIHLIKDVLDHLSEDKSASKMDIKIIMAVKNEEDDIEKLIRCVVAKDFAPYAEEITIVDQNSEDNTVKILESLAKEYHYLKIVPLKDTKEAPTNIL